MMYKKTFKTLLLSSFLIFLVNCSKKEVIPQDEVNDFVWGSMNAFYKWQVNVPDLSDKRFSSRSQLNGYLAGFNSPSDLFQSVRHNPNTTDKYSKITDDYKTMHDVFDGIINTNGLQLTVAQYKNGSDSTYAYVRYVTKGSNAEAQGLKRGTIFNKVNGQHLTTSNYNELLTNNNYTITEVNFNAGNPTSTIKTTDVTTTQLKENPIHVSKIFTRGAKKIGYIMYNKFITLYDDSLNRTFKQFKDNQVTDVIIDLRYNYSGALESSTYLASMITGQFKDELLTTQIWNEKVPTKVPERKRNSYFTDEINNALTKEPIKSLNLKTVYFIVSEKTAGASEVLINSLNPYIDVKVVGTKTAGVFLASTVLYDSDDYTFGSANFKTSHKWATIPTVLEAFDKNGQNKTNGIEPDVTIYESPENLGILGETSEPILKATIKYVTTGKKPSQLNNLLQPNNLWHSETTYTDYNLMYTKYNPKNNGN